MRRKGLAAPLTNKKQENLSGNRINRKKYKNIFTLMEKHLKKVKNLPRFLFMPRSAHVLISKKI
jgi:hypothetical protein